METSSLTAVLLGASVLIISLAPPGLAATASETYVVADGFVGNGGTAYVNIYGLVVAVETPRCVSDAEPGPSINAACFQVPAGSSQASAALADASSLEVGAVAYHLDEAGETVGDAHIFCRQADLPVPSQAATLVVSPAPPWLSALLLVSPLLPEEAGLIGGDGPPCGPNPATTGTITVNWA